MGTKITQNGHDFTYVLTFPGERPIVETWSFERVAGFMFLVEMHRQMSLKYSKERTYMNRYGNLVYTFDGMEFDNDTNRDLNRIFKMLSSRVTNNERQELWLMERWQDAIDWMENKVKDVINSQERPFEINGQVVELPRFLQRPTEEEYAERLEAERKMQEEEKAKEKARKAQPRPAQPKVLTTGTPVGKAAIGTHLKFNFIKYGVMECVVTGYSGRSYLVDVLRDGKVIETGWKFAFTSNRIVG